MHFTALLALVAVLPFSAAVSQGFNYGSAFTDGSPVQEADFEADFRTAQGLQGASGFTSARLFTTIQGGTVNAPTSAIQAAINTKTRLLLGLFLSAGQEAFNNELAALSSAIQQYGQPFLDLVDGISVGSEDLYRISPIGIINKSNPGDSPDNVVSYIGQTRRLIADTIFNSVPIGHVDTWTAWVNGSNSEVIDAVDFIGVDAYPYFQNTMPNSIENGDDLFFEAYNATVSVATGKPVYITETGWPVSGDVENQAVASIANAKTYWDQVGCRVFGNINTWWYTLSDSRPSTPSPSFGVVGNPLSTTPLFDLSCPGQSSSSSEISSASSSSSVADASATPASTTSSSDSTGAVTSSAQAFPHPAMPVGSPESNTQGPKGSSFASQPTGGSNSPGSGPALHPVSDSKPSTRGSAHPATTGQPQPGNDKNTLATVASQTGPTIASTPAATDGCPTILAENNYQFPHLIIPVSKESPDQAFGATTFIPEISLSTSDVYNFDIPPS